MAVAGRILKTIARNQLSRIELKGTDHTGGTQSKDVSTPEAVAYIQRSFDHLLMRSCLSASDFRDKVVMELGPGDNLGLALRLIAAGARKVVAVDRFAPVSQEAQVHEVYAGLRATLTSDEQERFDDAVDLHEGVSLNPARVELVQGVGIESMPPGCAPGSFDFILSVAVLEHVGDNDRAFQTMDRLLKPGGMMLHQVDLSDHGIFSRAGESPLRFLTIPDPVWRAMISQIGGPNRCMLDYYRRTLDGLGYTARITPTRIAGTDEDLEGPVPDQMTPARLQHVKELRPKLQRRYRALSTSDLLVSSIFITASKPGL
jgi:SAM-dependent methyltransferase